MKILKDINLLREPTKTKVKVFLDVVTKVYPNISIFETLRSIERQKYLYAAWRTRPWKKVTNTLKSKHLNWEAIDLVFLNKKWQPTWSWDYNFVHWIGAMCWLKYLSWEACHLEETGESISNVMKKNSIRYHNTLSKIEQSYLNKVNTWFRKFWYK